MVITMLNQLFVLWFQLHGSKWIKVGALIREASPPFLELLVQLAPFHDDRHRISPRHLGLLLAKHRVWQGRAGGWEAKTVQKQLAYRLIGTLHPDGRLWRLNEARSIDRSSPRAMMEAGRRAAVQYSIAQFDKTGALAPDPDGPRRRPERPAGRVRYDWHRDY
jgi:hypothetical protein